MIELREGGCHCDRVRFRARIDLDRLSECNCSICTKKGILHLPTDPADFELLKGKSALTVYTFETGMAQHTFCSHCGIHPFYNPRTDPENYSVNAHCLDDYDPDAMRSQRLFEGKNWEEAFTKRHAEWEAKH